MSMQPCQSNVSSLFVQHQVCRSQRLTGGSLLSVVTVETSSSVTWDTRLHQGTKDCVRFHFVLHRGRATADSTQCLLWVEYGTSWVNFLLHVLPLECAW